MDLDVVKPLLSRSKVTTMYHTQDAATQHLIERAKLYSSQHDTSVTTLQMTGVTRELGELSKLSCEIDSDAKQSDSAAGGIDPLILYEEGQISKDSLAGSLPS